MSTPPQTLVKISLPMFGKGYQQGRQRYFQECYILTDDVLLLCFEHVFEPSTHQNEDEEEREDALYYEIG
jgi:hypothetical protein